MYFWESCMYREEPHLTLIFHLLLTMAPSAASLLHHMITKNVSGKHSPASSFSSHMLTLDCSFGCNPSFFTAVPWPRLFLSSIYYSKLHEHLLNGSWNLISVLIKDGRQQAQKGADTSQLMHLVYALNQHRSLSLNEVRDIF